MTTTEKGSSFLIHRFMAEELKLTGGRLLIYALIYSFSRSKAGLYFGPPDYLSLMSGMSHSSVRRVLGELLDLGYIEKCTIRKKTGYRAVEVREEEDLNADMPPNEAEEELPSQGYMLEREIDVRELIAAPTLKPKYVFHSLSKMGLVSMTAEQYQRLLGLVDEDKLTGYIYRIEDMILNQGYSVHSPYRTIKRWIKEDAAP